MSRNPFVLLALALAVCVALAWGLPTGLEALKHSLAPAAPPEEAPGPAASGSGVTPTMPPNVTSTVPDIPSN